MEKTLVDSNIFLDYYLDRKDSLLPLGEFAFQFIKKAVSCEYFVIVCDLILEELEKILKIKREQVMRLIFSDLEKKQKLFIVEYSDELALNAKRIALKRSLPLNDCIFALIAKENNAFVVSRDRHFHELADLIMCKKPEEL
jgi:predicted nucleic acid-binding protein